MFNLIQRRLFFLLAVTPFLSGPLSVDAADLSGSVSQRLPSDPSKWLNSPPISPQMLQGKGLVLYFFEEDCPWCEKQWPKRLRESQQFAGKPVMFVAVNSGSSPKKIQRYVRQNKISWPVILDVDRSFEKKMGVKTISLKNIARAYSINGSGELRHGFWKDLKTTAERALIGARWRVDPEGIPNKMHDTWLAIEMGEYAAASKTLQRHRKSSKPDHKAAAKRMLDYIQDQLQVELDAIDQMDADEEHLQALIGLENVFGKYAGYSIDPKYQERLKELKRDDQLKPQIRAYKMLIKARQTYVMSFSPKKRNRAAKQIARIASQQADNFVGKEAQALIEQLSNKAIHQ